MVPPTKRQKLLTINVGTSKELNVIHNTPEESSLRYLGRKLTSHTIEEVNNDDLLDIVKLLPPNIDKLSPENKACTNNRTPVAPSVVMLVATRKSIEDVNIHVVFPITEQNHTAMTSTPANPIDVDNMEPNTDSHHMFTMSSMGQKPTTMASATPVNLIDIMSKNTSGLPMAELKPESNIIYNSCSTQEESSYNDFDFDINLSNRDESSIVLDIIHDVEKNLVEDATSHFKPLDLFIVNDDDDGFEDAGASLEVMHLPKDNNKATTESGTTLTWDEKFCKLKDFKAHCGHCNMQKKSCQYSSLGSWLTKQSLTMRKLENTEIQGGNKSKIKQVYRLKRFGVISSKIGALSLCFTDAPVLNTHRNPNTNTSSHTCFLLRHWSSKTNPWKHKFTSLMSYQEMYGNCDVPIAYTDHKPLGQ